MLEAELLLPEATSTDAYFSFSKFPLYYLFLFYIKLMFSLLLSTTTCNFPLLAIHKDEFVVCNCRGVKLPGWRLPCEGKEFTVCRKFLIHPLKKTNIKSGRGSNLC